MDEKVVEMNLSLDENASKENEVTVETVKHYEDTNQAEVEGTLVSIYDTGKSVLMTVLTTTGKDKNETSGITVVVGKDLREKVLEIKNGTRVHVNGALRCIPEKDNPGMYISQIFANEIEIAKSQLEEGFGLKGRVYDQSYNKIFVVGTVARLIQINRSYVKVVVQIKEGNKPRFVEGGLIARNMKNVISHVMVGSRICGVFEIRTSLDSLASGLAAERITDEELEHLQRLLVVIGEAIKEKNMEKIVEADTKFHDILYQASRNNRLVGIIYNLREQLTSFRAKSMAYPGRLEETLEEHRRIVDTIAQGDAVAAQKASEYHMERSEHTLLLSMEDKDGNM